jgi:hypothetical protein
MTSARPREPRRPYGNVKACGERPCSPHGHLESAESFRADRSCLRGHTPHAGRVRSGGERGYSVRTPFDLAARRVIDDDRSSLTKSRDAVGRIGGNDGHESRARDHGLAGDGDLEFALDDTPDLLLGVRVLMDRRPLGDLPVAESHVLGMHEPTTPPRTDLSGLDVVRVNEGHRSESGPTLGDAPWAPRTRCRVRGCRCRASCRPGDARVSSMAPPLHGYAGTPTSPSQPAAFAP